MSILLNGRQVEVILKQNTGDTAIDGSELDISSYLLTLGSLSWSVDENLTKLSLGNLAITVTDDLVETVWSFITSSLSSANGLLPPWIILNLDGTQTFIGIIKEAPIRNRESARLEISINAVDWSSMLESSRISATDTALQRQFNNDAGGWATGTTITCKSVYNKELRRGHDRQTVALDPSESANFSVGNWVYFNNYDGHTEYNKKFPITSTQTINVGGIGNSFCIYLGGGFQWLERPQNSQNFGQQSTLYRVYESVKNASPQFTVQETFTIATAGKNPKTSIILNYVDGLQPGDILNKVTTFLAANDPAFSITIVDVDVTTNTIFIDQPLNNDLVSGVTSFQLDAKSLAESVLQPVMPLIEKSLKGLASIDYSSYSPAILPTPCFSFISPESPTNQNTHTEGVSGIQDIQPNLTGYDVLGIAGKSWVGLPTSGWDTSTWTKKVNWTSQTSTAPAYVMPYVSLPADSGTTDTVNGHVTYPGLEGWTDNKNTDTALASGSTAIYKVVYDYSNLRYYQFQYKPSLSLTVTTWNGSTWTTVSGFSISGIGNPIDIVPFKDTTSSVGGGYGLLALYSDGTVKTILANFSLTNTLDGDTKNANGKLQVILKQTSNGIYYITPAGYGKIEIIAGVLRSKHVKLKSIIDKDVMPESITPITSTFLYSNGRIITLAKVSYKNSYTDERTIDDTYLFQLNKDIQTTAVDSIYSFDYLLPMIPRITMAVKSPVSEDIFGIMGSRLFQITKYLPDTVERFTSTNQTASAIIEFVCAMTNSVAIPNVKGKIKLYSRGYNTSVTNVNVDIVSINEARWNKHLASCVVIKGLDAKKGVAISTTQKAGLTISYSNEVYIRNSSQAQAIANSYLSFFEKPRKEITQVWYSQTTPCTWETLEPMSVITINGGTTQYYLTGLSHDLEKQTATVTLLEVL